MTKNRHPIKSIACNKSDFGKERGKVLYLCMEGDHGRRDAFTIHDVVGDGGSCVCYEATNHTIKMKGRLKEFYPLDPHGGLLTESYYGLCRNAGNQVVSTAEGEGAEHFLRARDEFVASHHLLRDIIRESKKGDAGFTSFIPDCRIYYACDEQGNALPNSTVYIWTDPAETTVFSDVIRDIHAHPKNKPEHSLYVLLKTISALTDCVRILHEHGLLHLDIKPANFGIQSRSKTLLTDSVWLFDINSVYAIGQETLPAFSGTEGFCAPELSYGEPTNKCDIYSIGCTLFSALVPPSMLEDGHYSKKYYARIPELIASSPLISACETNSNMYLQWELCNILKRCLVASTLNRYDSCTDLRRDLETAISYLLPAEFNSHLPDDMNLVILKREMDKPQHSPSSLIFKYHLYREPLYRFVGQSEDTVNVLIVGFGNYGQRFLDCCLQVAQMYGKRLSFRVVSGNRNSAKKDKDFYLAERDALAQFFRIDGSPCPDPYGEIRFETATFSQEDSEANRALTAELLSRGPAPHYIFVALGDDELNRSVAEQLVAATPEGKQWSVNYTQEGERRRGRTVACPVYMHEDIRRAEGYDELDRMALNAYIVWKKRQSVDFSTAAKDFRNPYHYNACIANAVGIRYKLYSLGIAMDDSPASANEAAAQFHRLVHRNDGSLRYELAAVEHRRWVCDKLADKWMRKTDISGCARGDINDTRERRHVCMVRSTSAHPLDDTTVWSREVWDTADEDMLATLDPLDELSVRLHQVFLQQANAVRRTTALYDHTVSQIRELIADSPKASQAFSEWFSCLSMIWNQNSNQARIYQALRKALLDSLGDLDAADSKTVKLLVKIVDDRFTPILRSMQYTSYKSNDLDFIEHIPYILTYRHDMHLVVPFTVGGNSDMFANVAAATVVSPARLTYLYHVEHKDQLPALRQALDYAARYLKEKKLTTKLHLLLTYVRGAELEAAVTRLQTEMTNTPVRSTTIRAVTSQQDIADALRELLSSRRAVTAIEQNVTALSYLLLGCGFYHDYPHYQFDPNAMRFITAIDCQPLTYIHTPLYLRVSDMFAIKNSKGVSTGAPLFDHDVDRLWHEIYREQPRVWKVLCELLERHSRERDVFARFALTITPSETVTLRFLLPFEAFEAASKVMQSLTAHGILQEGSELHFRNTDCCEVVLCADAAYKRSLTLVFSNPYAMTYADHLSLFVAGNQLLVRHDNLLVTRFNPDRYPDVMRSVTRDQIVALLERLSCDFGYVANIWSPSENEINFTYATHKVKDLLTTAGRLFEVYVYRKCISSHRFDDVVSGYEVSWDGTDVKSEFDIVLTRDFRSLIVETKARDTLDQDFYFKLSCLAKQFGINCTAVLLADMSLDAADRNANRIGRTRGDMLGVVTISDPEDINRIDETLENILKGT